MNELVGKRILVVEDEAVLALELSLSLRDIGAEISGPCHSLRDAIEQVDASIAAAILDVDLKGHTVFSLADKLTEHGVPFLFHTGRADLEPLMTRYKVPICEKPSSTEVVLAELAAVIQKMSLE